MKGALSGGATVSEDVRAAMEPGDRQGGDQAVLQWRDSVGRAVGKDGGAEACECGGGVFRVPCQRRRGDCGVPRGREWYGAPSEERRQQ